MSDESIDPRDLAPYFPGQGYTDLEGLAEVLNTRRPIDPEVLETARRYDASTGPRDWAAVGERHSVFFHRHALLLEVDRLREELHELNHLLEHVRQAEHPLEKRARDAHISPELREELKAEESLQRRLLHPRGTGSDLHKTLRAQTEAVINDPPLNDGWQ